ncbi:hypothetical protein BGW36DRAFT_464526 [Talaromyces proteolyticus]|uniref:C2H2-type domain-containing protein n=1 Tax=Talaromyces proteolyticus TaxID=1131652 RepID=A0AAD4KHL3_9EURO|nr:uncharacterized protein BGW36DRAFT_464526 [Talaromyces proteolyticus]KAH8691921.1 hypothetical protein BGW36DRAFT_464526 [Talaromyces proteolyticus]
MISDENGSDPDDFLERVEIDYGPHGSENQPSKADGKNVSSSGNLKDRLHKRSQRRTIEPSQGDYTLIRALEPNRPDIAGEVGDNPLRRDVESDNEDEDNRAEVSRQQPRSNNTIASFNDLVAHKPGKPGVGKYALSLSDLSTPEIPFSEIQFPSASHDGLIDNSQTLPSMKAVSDNLGSVVLSSFSVSASSSRVIPPQRQTSGQLPTPYFNVEDMNQQLGSEFNLQMAAPADKSPINNHPVPVEAKVHKCTFPNCTAAFTNKHSLSSHGAVHKDHRPHYCPVPGCERGVGGKGFKRKYDMDRHGLVHDSPVYGCPFCTDSQHKYPREDNLQRHVKDHHPDKDKDDPELRTVLAQKREGSGRGRPRRDNT